MTSPQDPPAPCPVSVTDCPQCGALCLGAITLPCGHLMCRKCCRHLLHHHGWHNLTCGCCEQHLPFPDGCSSVSQVVQQLGTDPVVQDLVQQRLRSQKHLCHIHKETAATMVCEDCQEHYCDICSHVHRKLGMSSDHVLRLLPTAGHDLSSESFVPPRPRAYSTSSIPSALSIGNLSVASDESSMSNAELRDKSEMRQWLHKVGTLLQQASRKKHAFISSLKEMASVINQVLSTEAEQDELLQAYTNLLARFHDVQQNDTHTFVITDDFMKTLNMEHLEQRLLNFIDTCQSTSVMSADRIRTVLQLHDDLFHSHEPQGNRSSVLTSPTNTSITTTSITAAIAIPDTTADTTIATDTSSNIAATTGTTTALTNTTIATTTAITITTDTVAAASATNTNTTNTTAATIAPTASEQPPTHSTTTSSLISTHMSSASSALPRTHTSRAVNLMKANPSKVFVATPASADDVKKPWITSIASTQEEKLIMADRYNSKVKVVDMSDPHTVSASLTVEETPRRLAVLSDGLVAVTTLEPTIYLLRVSPTLAVKSCVQTGRRYTSVAEGLTDHTLLVSCRKTHSDPARVDLITRGGEVVRTVVDSTMLTGLSDPDYLCIVGSRRLLVFNWENRVVYGVDTATSKPVSSLTHSFSRLPGQVCVDGEGNIYIASYDGQCVLVRSTKEQWRKIVCSPDHTDQGCDRPQGICFTRSGRLVVAWCSDDHTVVMGYDLR